MSERLKKQSLTKSSGTIWTALADPKGVGQEVRSQSVYDAKHSHDKRNTELQFNKYGEMSERLKEQSLTKLQEQFEQL